MRVPSGRMLIRQFLIESIVIAAISTIIALGLSWLLLPYFNMLANKTLSISVMFTPLIIGSLAGLAVLVGGISGSYPALYLSSFDPAEVIKGQSDLRGRKRIATENPGCLSIRYFSSHDHRHFHHRFPVKLPPGFRSRF